MVTSNDTILDQSLMCLVAHRHPEWGDRVLFDVFNRLLAKNIKPSEWTSNTHLDIHPEQISSRQEQWTTEDLAKLLRGHGSAEGKDFDCPIIVAKYDGKQRLLDGNHRINRWIEVGDTMLHDINIHTIAGIGQFVELPAIQHDA